MRTGETTAAGLATALQRRGAARSEVVVRAFREVPRHLFLPGVPMDLAYLDEAVPVKFDGRRIASSSSQPTMMALMLEQLDLRPGHRVLEIGTGTGYNAALMGHLVGPHGSVHTVDIEADLVARAADHLRSAGAGNVVPVHGDGSAGHAAAGPYDRIIATCGLWDVPAALVAQLAEDGRMVLPLSVRGSQLSIALERDGSHLRSVSVLPCGFMRLRGPGSGPEHKVTVDEANGLRVLVPDGRVPDVEAVRATLHTPPATVRTGVRATLGEVHDGLDLWLSVTVPDVVQLVASGPPEQVAAGPVPCMYEWKNPPWHERVTLAELTADGVAALARDPGDPLDVEDPAQFELLVAAFAGGNAAALVDRVRAWDRVGRPRVRDVTVEVHPAGDVPVPEGAVAVPKHESILFMRWH